MIFMSGNSGKSTTLALILLSVGVLVFVLAAREARDRPTAISVTRATHQNLSSWITTNGKVEPLEPHTIQSQLTTFIETVALKEGQSVNRGQVLMTLNAKDLKTELAHMREQLVAAENERKIAPAGGTVYSLPARPGTYVHTGDLLAELADLTRIRVRVFVDEPELGSLKQEQAVEITWEALPDRTWNGLVDRLPKTIVARGSRNVGEVLSSLDNKTGELLPNTNVNVRIRTGRRENSLTLARAAVRGEGNARYVFV